jgi:hypothetical protein
MLQSIDAHNLHLSNIWCTVKLAIVAVQERQDDVAIELSCGF